MYGALELLMMGVVVPEAYWAASGICSGNHLFHLVGILFPHINDNARSFTACVRLQEGTALAVLYAFVAEECSI